VVFSGLLVATATHHCFVVPVVYLEMKLLEGRTNGGPSAALPQSESDK